MTQEKNGSDPVFTPDIKNSISLPFFPQQYLSEEKQPFKKNYRIPVDHIAKIINE
jgi:hypothetical protein